jgi:hypothetical protein
VTPCLLSEAQIADYIENAQYFDDSDGKHLLGNSLVLAGEEDTLVSTQLRKKIHACWKYANAIVIIGYSFGIGSHLGYDAIWRDEFIDAVSGSRTPIHIIDPRAASLREELSHRLRRTLDIFSWPLSWFLLSRAMLEVGRASGASSICDVVQHEKAVRVLYDSCEETWAAA